MHVCCAVVKGNELVYINFRYSNFPEVSAPSSSHYAPPVMTPTNHQQGNQYTSNISKVGYSKFHGNWSVNLPDTKAPASDGDQRPVPVIQINDADAPMYESINEDYLLRPEGDTSSSKLGADLLQGRGNSGESIDSNQLQIQGSRVYCNAYKEIGGITSGKEQDILDDDPCSSILLRLRRL